MFLRIPNSRAINLKVVKLYVVKKCVFLVAFGANQVGRTTGVGVQAGNRLISNLPHIK